MGGATKFSRLTRRLIPFIVTPVAAVASVGMVFTGTATAAQVLVPSSIVLQQWDPAGAGSWINSNLNSGYAEGDVVPFRLNVTAAGNTAAGNTSVFSICRDYEDASPAPGKYGYFFIDAYNTTESPAVGATVGSTVSDVTPAATGDAVVTIVSVNEMNAKGACAVGERETKVEFTIASLNGAEQAYVLWGGHLASPFDSGVAPRTGASSYPGSNLHMATIPAKSLPIKVDEAPAGTLTVTKVVQNTFGGTLTAADFPLFVDGSPVTSGAATTLPAGSHTVSETQQTGYERLSFGGACASDGTVTLGDGQNLVCTITNHDVAPTLTVIKHVVNDNGGSLDAADFTMNVSGTDVSDTSFDGSETGTTVTLDAGSYSVTESGPVGYADSFSAGCSGTIALGETKTCTITNDDRVASLTVVKDVVNDNGGTLEAGDFTINVTGNSVSAASFPGNGAGHTVTLNAGSYSVSETAVNGYTGTFSADCAGTIAPGESKTCTVTNDDEAPTLTVIKTVVNDDEGDLDAGDFTMHVAGLNVSDGSFPGDEDGTTVTLDAGSYAVTEDTTSGYTGTFSTACAGTIGVGQSRTCTVTNNDIPVVVPPVEPAAGHIVVRKVTLPTASTQAFPFTADFDVDGFSLAGGGSIDSGELRPDTYSVTETATAGWNLTSATCDDGSNPASIALGAGEIVTCTFTNTLIPVTVPTETEGVTQTQGSPNVPVETATVTAVPPADVPKATAPVTIPQTSPTAAEELPRTGAAGLREETLLGLLLMLAGLLAKAAGRRTRPSDV